MTTRCQPGQMALVLKSKLNHNRVVLVKTYLGNLKRGDEIQIDAGRAWRCLSGGHMWLCEAPGLRVRKRDPFGMDYIEERNTAVFRDTRLQPITPPGTDVSEIRRIVKPIKEKA